MSLTRLGSATLLKSGAIARNDITRTIGKTYVRSSASSWAEVIESIEEGMQVAECGAAYLNDANQ